MGRWHREGSVVLLGAGRPRWSWRLLLAAHDQCLQPVEALLQQPVLLRHAVCLRRQSRVALPPIDAHLDRLIDGRDKQPQPDAEKLHADEANGYVACDHHAVVENAVENVCQRRALYGVLHSSFRHGVASEFLAPAQGDSAVICSTTPAVFSRNVERSRRMRQLTSFSSYARQLSSAETWWRISCAARAISPALDDRLIASVSRAISP